MKPILFRPPDSVDGRSWDELFRYTKDGFVPDDGEPGLAFVGSAEHWPYAYGHDVPFHYDEHPNKDAHEAAMTFGSKRYGVCNGRHVSLKATVELRVFGWPDGTYTVMADGEAIGCKSAGAVGTAVRKVLLGAQTDEEE